MVECSNLVKWMMNWSRTFWIDYGFGYGPHPYFVCSLFYLHLLLPMQTKEWGAKSQPGVEAMCVIHLNTCLCILPISDLITNVLQYHKCTSCVSLLVRILCHKLSSSLRFYYCKIIREECVGIHGTRLVLLVAFVLTLYMTWISRWYMTKCSRHCWHYTLP